MVERGGCRRFGVTLFGPDGAGEIEVGEIEETGHGLNAGERARERASWTRNIPKRQ